MFDQHGIVEIISQLQPGNVKWKSKHGSLNPAVVDWLDVIDHVVMLWVQHQ